MAPICGCPRTTHKIGSNRTKYHLQKQHVRTILRMIKLVEILIAHMNKKEEHDDYTE